MFAKAFETFSCYPDALSLLYISIFSTIIAVYIYIKMESIYGVGL